jgi:hypothetical protein
MSGIIAQNSGRHTGLVKAASGGGVWNLIETLTASSSATLDFTSGIDSTYDEYVFKFINIHPEDDDVLFQFNLSSDSGSNYNVTKTTTNFEANHNEADSATSLTYKTARDLAQSTSDQIISNEPGNDNDQGMSGYMHLFSPSDTTFVKHFIINQNSTYKSDYSVNVYIAGYANTTSAVDAIRFQFSANNIDAGTISLYGIS